MPNIETHKTSEGTENPIRSLLAKIQRDPSLLEGVSGSDLRNLASLLDRRAEDLNKAESQEYTAQRAVEEEARQSEVAQKYGISPEDVKLAEETLMALKKGGKYGNGKIVEIPAELSGNENFAIDALDKDSDVWDRLPENLKSSESFQERALKEGGSLFEKFDQATRANEKIALLAFKMNPWRNYELLPDSLKQNQDFLFSAIKGEDGGQNFSLTETLRLTPFANNRDFIMKGLDQGLDMTLMLSDELSSDREIFLKASEFSASAINQASPELRSDREFLAQCLDAVLKQPDGKQKAQRYFLMNQGSGENKQMRESLLKRMVGLE